MKTGMKIFFYLPKSFSLFTIKYVSPAQVILVINASWVPAFE